MLELLRLSPKMLQELADEGAGAGCGIEDLDIVVDKRLAEMVLTQPFGALNHEANDLVRRVDHAETICSLRIIDLVKALVDDLQKGLLFSMGGDLCGVGSDGGIVGLKRTQGISFDTAGEKLRFERVEGLGDIIFTMEVTFVEHMRKDFFCENVLNQHLADVGLPDRGVDRLLGLLEEGDGGGLKGGVARIRIVDLRAECR